MRRSFLDVLRVHRIIEAGKEPNRVPDWLDRALESMTPEEVANILWLQMQGELEEGIAAARAELSISGSFDLTPERALRYLADHVMDFAQDMVENERDGLRALVTDGLSQGWGAAKLSRNLHGYFRSGVHYTDESGKVARTVSIGAWAETVARTELSRAYNQGSRSLYEEAGIEERVWVAANDAHECPECEAADGEVAKIGEPFPSVEVEDPPAHPRCCPPGTLIATPAGLRAIEKIAVGDLVISHTGSARRVLATVSNDVSEELIELRVGSARLRLTGNHPVCTPNGWARADALQPGDQVIHMAPEEALPRGIDRDASHAGTFENREYGLAGNVRGVHRPSLVVEQSPRWHAAIVSLDSVERPYYRGPVYNMQVDVDESYVAAGIAVHNCYCVTMASPDAIERYNSPENAAHRAEILARNRAFDAGR